MSGDRSPATWPPPSPFGERSVALAADARGFVAGAVQSLGELPDALPRHALVGGLAVMVRLYEAHRATTDFDEVTEGREAAIALLVDDGAERTANGVLLRERGLRLDLLDAETDAVTLVALDVDAVDEEERRALQLAFVCRYALDTAVPTDVVVFDGDEIAARVTMPVAVAGALVAMKLHAAIAPDREAAKAAGDAYDAYRLIRAWGPSVVAADLSRAPIPMLQTSSVQVRALFGDDVDRTAHRLRSASVPGIDAVDVDDLAGVVGLATMLDVFAMHDGSADRHG